jgi:hypothetical protein
VVELRKELEEDDPYELVAMRLPAPPGWDAPALMARTFIEEFALMGWKRNRIMQLFRSKAFAGSHAVYEERGEAFIARLMDEVFGPEGEADDAQGA